MYLFQKIENKKRVLDFYQIEMKPPERNISAICQNIHKKYILCEGEIEFDDDGYNEYLGLLNKNMDPHIVKFLEDISFHRIADDDNDILDRAVILHQPKQVFSFLFSIGANVNRKNHMGETVLHSACRFHTNAISSLLSNRAVDVNIKNNKNLSPLQILCGKPTNELDFKAISDLVEYTQTDLTVNVGGFTHSPLLFWLINSFRDFENAPSKWSSFILKAFRITLWKGDCDMRQIFLGNTYLSHCFKYNPNAIMIEELLKKGADPNEDSEFSPLRYGIIEDEPDLLILLILSGCTVDKKTEQFFKYKKFQKKIGLFEDFKEGRMWNVERHKHFPFYFKQKVEVLLLIHKFKLKVFIPKPLLLQIFGFFSNIEYKTTK